MVKVIKHIEKLQWGFFWQGKETKKKCHLAKRSCMQIQGSRQFGYWRSYGDESSPPIQIVVEIRGSVYLLMEADFSKYMQLLGMVGKPKVVYFTTVACGSVFY